MRGSEEWKCMPVPSPRTAANCGCHFTSSATIFPANRESTSMSRRSMNPSSVRFSYLTEFRTAMVSRESQALSRGSNASSLEPRRSSGEDFSASCPRHCLVIISAMGIVILWTFAVPWGEETPNRQDAEGLWEYVDSSSHTVQLQLRGDSTAEVGGWPSSVGCAGPLESPERLRANVDWRVTSDFRGQWMLRNDFGGLALEVVSSSVESCHLYVPLRFQRNILTGAKRMLFSPAAYDEPFFDQVFAFEQLRS